MGWEQLRDILKDGREELRRERTETPTTCPVCGHRLNYSEVRGLLACPMDDWRGLGRGSGT
jgi:transposase